LRDAQPDEDQKHADSEVRMNKLTHGDFDVDTTTKIEKPKTRAQKIEEWRKAHQAEYGKTCHDVQCTCTPSRAQALIIAAYENPPID
jgi:hypothetical protein